LHLWLCLGLVVAKARVERVGLIVVVVEWVHLHKHVHVLILHIEEGVKGLRVVGGLRTIVGHLIEEQIHVYVEVEIVEVVLQGLISLLVHQHSLLIILHKSTMRVQGLSLLDCWRRVVDGFVNFDLFIGV